MADRAARLAGDLGRSHRSGIAGAGDGRILRGRARTRIRRVVRRLGGCRRPRSHVRWPARRRPVLAGRLPDQCTARPRRPVADATLRGRRAGRRPERKPGFARYGAHGIGIGWTVCGRNFGPAARLVQPLRLRCTRHWRHRDGLVALVAVARTRSTCSAGAVPVAQFHRDESFDARHLRRPRGHVLLLDLVSPGDARVFRGGGGGRHDAGRASLGVVFVATGRVVRPLRRALAPDARADAHGRRRPLASRIPSTSPAWDLSAAAQTFTPPSGYVTSVLPGLLLFGLGATLMVAPLTATVMASVPVERAGVASAVNTAISDVGPQLAVAVLFVAMTQNFYGALARDAPGLDVASAAVRHAVAPLNVPGPGVSEEVQRAARDASTGAFRLAMVVAAVLLFAGAVINAAGLRLPSGAPVVRVASADPLWRRCRHVAQERPANP